jgi:Protein of unknown function (DUF4245)
MSQTQTSGGGRYQRSTGGLLGAMIVTVLAVAAFAGIQALKTDHPKSPVREVDYQAMVRAGRAESKLLVLAPADLPSGWKATSATYLTGSSPTWHLGLLTDKGSYVGVEEALGGVDDLVEEYVDPEAVRGKDVEIDGTTYQTWTDAGGDYALAREVGVEGGPAYQSVVIVGSASASTIRDFAATLEGGKLRLAG